MSDNATKQDVKELKEATSKDIAKLSASTSKDITKLSAKVDRLETKLDHNIDRLEKKIDDAVRDISDSIQVLGTMIADKLDKSESRHASQELRISNHDGDIGLLYKKHDRLVEAYEGR